MHTLFAGYNVLDLKLSLLHDTTTKRRATADKFRDSRACRQIFNTSTPFARTCTAQHSTEKRRTSVYIIHEFVEVMRNFATQTMPPPTPTLERGANNEPGLWPTVELFRRRVARIKSTY